MALSRGSSRNRLIPYRDLFLGIVLGILIGILTLEGSLFPFRSGTLLSSHSRDVKLTIGNDLEMSMISTANISSSSLTVAQQLAKEIRILCLVFTTPENHLTRAVFVKNTWGKHCNYLLFMSTIQDPVIDSIALNLTVGRKHLWGKTKMSFQYAFDHYLEKADWFLKADDDTFVILENLRYFLMNRDASNPVYFGCHFKPYIQNGYMSGGAGYVLSRKAVELFVEIGLVKNLGLHCKKGTGSSEDVEMGRCMQAVGVKVGNTIAGNGGYRFNPFSPDIHLSNDQPAWFRQYVKRQQPEGMKCCSDSAISFHYIKSDEMTAMYYLTYALRVDGKEEEDRN